VFLGQRLEVVLEIVAGSSGLVGVWWMLALTAIARAGAMTSLWQWGRWERARA